MHGAQLRKLLPLLALMLFSSPCWATISIVQHVTSTSLSGMTITATTAGNTLVFAGVNFNGSHGAFSISAVSDGADSFTHAPNTAATNTAGTPQSDCDIWYFLSATAGQTTITVTSSGGSGHAAELWEIHSTAGTLLFDTSNSVSNTASSSTPLGVSLTTAANSASFAVNASFSQSTTGTVANGGDTFHIDDDSANGEGFASLLNVGAGAHQVQWQMSGADATTCSATISVKEAGGGGGGGSRISGPSKIAGPARID